MLELECLAYGVGHAEEGVCLLVRMGPHRILLDCGLRDLSPLITGRDDETKTSQEPLLPADLVWCSHAHADHARGLLALHQAFPQLPIYASEVTTQLLPLNWPGVELSPHASFCQALPWQTPVEFREGLSAELWPAGHLPGAAALLLTYTPPQRPQAPPVRPYTLFYTGDFFLSNSRLVDGLPLEVLRGLKPDVLIVEGTYGTARHLRRRQQENQLAERISHALADHRSVLLPTPTLGLGQELLMLLRSHHHFTGRDVDIWVDGAIADACDAYLDLLPHLPSTVQNFAQHQPLFWDERVRPRVRRVQNAEQRQTLGQTPCIVLTDQSLDLSQYSSSNNTNWIVLLTDTEGRGISRPFASESYLLSEHCDGAGTTQLIHNLRPQHVVFIHASPLYLADLTNLDELHNRYHLHTPGVGSLVELPIGETFIQPAAPEGNYEGELTEWESTVTIRLPDAIASDPRWQTFADTGLIEARWQGQELVLRGLSQWELLNQERDLNLQDLAEGRPLRDCCGTCLHYRGQNCRNPASPLYGFKVTAEGYCPVFESRFAE
ncbi:MAG: MBL fold metallo-hydrolase [Leptolyngbyaceae bacterium]|nr:MBL fold metallo-hydrolase [Leptolyngbyaceae bacterium]